MPSDPLFTEWDDLLTLRAALLNPSCHADLATADPVDLAAAADQVTAAVDQAWSELTR